MRLTLILIGCSLLLLAPYPIYYAIENQYVPYIADVIFGYLSSILEKIGIIIDIAWLFILLIALK